jgi:hypothetical protein
MEAALTGVVELLDRGGEWTIAIEETGGGARMTVRDRDRKVALDRRVVSADCRAMAGAFAVVLHGFFRQLAGDVPAGPGGPAPPARDHEARDQAPRELAAEPAGPREAGIDLGMAAGATLSDETGASASGSLDGGWRLAPRLTARTRLSGAAPVVQERDGERVELQGAALAVGVGYRLDGGRLWFRPALLAGVSAWRVDPIDLEDAPTRVRFHPIATVVTAAGLRLGDAVSLRAEVSEILFLRTDRYLVVPDGEVARSPRTALSVGVGLEWAIFP